MTSSTTPTSERVIGYMAQANNMFRFKKMLDAAVDAVLSPVELSSLFPESRDRTYYLKAATNNLGIVTQKNGTITLTAKGLSMQHLSDQEFAAKMHEALMQNDVVYDAVVAGDLQTIESTVRDIDNLSDTTKNRRLATYISWKNTLAVMKAGDALKVIQERARHLRQEKRSDQKKMESMVPLYRENVSKQRTFQEKFRSNLFALYGANCAVTGVAIGDMLRASHIKPCRDCEPREAVDFHNGLPLECRFDNLFDKGYISFAANGAMLVSSLLSNVEREALNIKDGMKLSITPTAQTQKYMEYHRKHVFKHQSI